MSDASRRQALTTDKELDELNRSISELEHLFKQDIHKRPYRPPTPPSLFSKKSPPEKKRCISKGEYTHKVESRHSLFNTHRVHKSSIYAPHSHPHAYHTIQSDQSQPRLANLSMIRAELKNMISIYAYDLNPTSPIDDHRDVNIEQGLKEILLKNKQ
jgi:hypothetical protein